MYRCSYANSKSEKFEDHFDKKGGGECHVEVSENGVVCLVLLRPGTIVELHAHHQHHQTVLNTASFHT